MNELEFLSKHKANPSETEFEESIAVVDQNYQFNPVSFKVGEQLNEMGTNLGSCKLFAFAKRHDLNEQETLHLFGRFYREDVLGNPDGEDHQNIRNFIQYGWERVEFKQAPLNSK